MSRPDTSMIPCWEFRISVRWTNGMLTVFEDDGSDPLNMVAKLAETIEQVRKLDEILR